MGILSWLKMPAKVYHKANIKIKAINLKVVIPSLCSRTESEGAIATEESL